MSNALAEIWYQCIINGTLSIDKCPEKDRLGNPLKSVVVQMIKERQ